MGKVRVFFHRKNEHFVRGLVQGTAVLLTGSRHPSDIQRFEARLNARVPGFSSGVYKGNVRTALIDSGHLAKLYPFHEVVKVKNFRRKGERTPTLVAESLRNEKKGQAGVLVTPFSAEKLVARGKKPKSLGAGARIKVNPRQNIVAASFSGYEKLGLDPQRLVLVATQKTQKLLAESARPRTLHELIEAKMRRTRVGSVATIVVKTPGHSRRHGTLVLRYRKLAEGKYVPMSKKAVY